MPDLLIDVTRLLYRRWVGHLPTGIDRVGLEYLRHYAPRSRAVVDLRGFSAVLSRPDSAPVFQWLLDPGRERRSRAAWRLAKARPASLASGGANGHFLFNTGHSGLQHARYGAALRRGGARPIFVIHDLIPLTNPQYCRPGESDRHARRIGHALRYAHGLVVNSAQTLGELSRFAAAARLPMPPAVVAHLGPCLPPVPPGPRPLAAPYFVVLGTIEPRKNHMLLVRVWRRLIEELGTAAPRLIVIGQPGWGCESVGEAFERDRSLRGFVARRRGCSDNELVTVLHHARALLFPSFAEGFGLPLIEALALGVPVIASNLDVFHEFAGDVPDYASPRDDARWLELVMDYAGPASALRAAQMARTRAYRAPEWRHHLNVVDALLARLQRGG